MSDYSVDPRGTRREARRFGIVMGVVSVVAAGMGFGACWITRGSSDVAEKWVADIRGNHLDEAMPVVSTEVKLDDPIPTKAIELIRTGKGDVSSGMRGFGHNDEWVPYACHTVDERVWMVMMKREGRWKIVELHTTQPKGCESD